MRSSHYKQCGAFLKTDAALNQSDFCFLELIMSEKGGGAGGGPRRGSSLFSGPGAASGAPPSKGPPPKVQGSAPMMGGPGGRRNSSVLQIGQPGGGIGFGIDFDDSDYEDSDDDDVPYGGPRGGALPGQPVPGNRPATGAGSANSRPMVGGFAAAAYEAARAHHFQNLAKQGQSQGNQRGGQPPRGGRPQGY